MVWRSDDPFFGERHFRCGFGGVQAEHLVVQHRAQLVLIAKPAGLAGSEQRQHDAGMLVQLALVLSRKAITACLFAASTIGPAIIVVPGILAAGPAIKLSSSAAVQMIPDAFSASE